MDLAILETFGDQIDAFLWPEQDPKLQLKRERILLAASELFVRQGYRKTSIDEVARGAGVAKGTVYLYYRSKAELVCHAIAMEKRDHLHRMAPLADPSLTPRDRLRSLIALGLIMSREMPLTTSLIQGDHEIELAMQEMDEQLLHEVNERQADLMLALLDGATTQRWPKAQLKIRGQVLIDLMFAVATSSRTNAHGLAWEEYAGTLADIIVDGVLHDSQDPVPAIFLTSARTSDRQGAYP